MAKILISWIALNADFIKGTGKVDPNGTNSTVHECCYDYDYHLLLSDKTPNNDLPHEVLLNHLLRTYEHDIRVKHLNIQDVIDVREIKVKVEELLYEYKNDEIEIFISPGTPSMQVAWYLAHLGLKLKTKLFQIRQGKHTKSKQPEKVYVDFKKSSLTFSIMLTESVYNDSNDDNTIITKSFKPIYDIAERVAGTNNTSVLILGETGTGKEKLARYIHKNSHRANKTFIAINCASLGDQLLESRLFGYMKGAYTGAEKTTNGYFQRANGGTIFLDEIGDITPYMQQTLLRVLEEKKVYKIGSTEEEAIDVRIISATNKDLIKLCDKNEFRRDLFYRLSIVDLELPSLKEIGIKEKEEIFNFLLKKHQNTYNRKIPIISKEIKNIILSHMYTGNIREMQNLVCRLYSISENEVKEKDLPKVFANMQSNSMKLQDVVKNHIKNTYLVCNENASLTARMLDISLNTVKKNLAD